MKEPEKPAEDETAEGEGAEGADAAAENFAAFPESLVERAFQCVEQQGSDGG